ncbi:MAG: HAMP domain-containing protein, partial [Deltaproteobacteria bacterium]|nr:HAMP domain-containing protein [Deltaproteobacteria bacterium]
MSIATKITLVVTFLAGLFVLGVGYAGLFFEESQRLTEVRDQGRLMVSVLKTSAEADLRNHGRQGAVADMVSQESGQKVIFYGPDGRAVAPVPIDATPDFSGPIRRVIESREARETVETLKERSFYILRSPLWNPRGEVAGAIELSIDLAAALNRSAWLSKSALVAGALMMFFVLFIAVYARRSIGRPITRLMAGMDAMIRGDLTHTIPLDRNDEIGRIAYRFNEMTARLHAAQGEIRASADAKLQLEGNLRHSEKLATIGQLSAEIAHEVGTPLNVIGGRVRTLKRRANQPTEVKKNAEIIATQVTRITSIIQQVLDLARAPARKRSAVDVPHIVDDAVAFLEYQLSQAHIAISRDYASRVPRLEAEPDGIQQVVLNLLLNAIQAMPEGGKIALGIGTTHRRKGGLDLAPPQTYLALTVTDTGVGIPEDQQGKIFDPFFSTKAKGEGTGLGLTVVHGIVKGHDGWIDVDSSPGKGTTFRVFLPLEDDSKDPEQNPSESAKSGPEEGGEEH